MNNVPMSKGKLAACANHLRLITLEANLCAGRLAIFADMVGRDRKEITAAMGETLTHGFARLAETILAERWTVERWQEVGRWLDQHHGFASVVRLAYTLEGMAGAMHDLSLLLDR